jgi:hypothetical protein
MRRSDRYPELAAFFAGYIYSQKAILEFESAKIINFLRL